MEEVETNQYPKADLARVLYTILYLIIGRFISMLLFVIAACQLIYSWLIGEPNEKLLHFTGGMSEYAKQLVAYVGFNSDKRPWPAGDWPSNEGL
ncbi:MAG: DUF4389 domain-containing protein [Campylobacterota bacterium]|nr:DUF4389 domain-containing protein [Campylobacterota bacterium]